MEESAKIGRPTKYKEEYCEMLINHMKEGYSFESFAGLVSVSKQTIYDWEKANPEFLDAKKIGSQKSLLKWEGLGMELANGNKKGSASSYIFNMKNRFNWSDKQEIEQSTKIEINIDEDDSNL